MRRDLLVQLQQRGPGLQLLVDLVQQSPDAREFPAASAEASIIRNRLLFRSMYSATVLPSAVIQHHPICLC